VQHVGLESGHLGALDPLALPLGLGGRLGQPLLDVISWPDRRDPGIDLLLEGGNAPGGVGRYRLKSRGGGRVQPIRRIRLIRPIGLMIAVVRPPAALLPRMRSVVDCYLRNREDYLESLGNSCR
jgi:hypothetical protein